MRRTAFGILVTLTLAVGACGTEEPTRPEIDVHPKFALAASILGPTYIDYPTDTFWVADLTDDSVPSYNWFRMPNGQGWSSVCSNSATCNLSITTGTPSFLLLVEVTDETGFAADTISVTVDIPAPLSGGVFGPTDVNENETCTWFASVSGGYTPYSYAWDGVGTGSSSNISIAGSSMGGGGWLELTVTDNHSQSVIDSIFITVDETNMQDPCFN